MAFVHGSKARVFLNGYDLSTDTKSLSFALAVDTAESSTLGTTAKTYVVGLNDATLSLEGIFNGAVDTADDIIRVALASVAVDNYTYFMQGFALGNPGYGFAAHTTSYEASADIGDVSQWSLEGQSNTGTEPLRLYHDYVAEAAGGQTGSVDNTLVQTILGGVGYLHASTGAALVVKVQDSADNTTFADILTFNTVAGRTSERRVIAGTVRRYTRVLWTGTGTFAVAFGRY